MQLNKYCFNLLLTVFVFTSCRTPVPAPDWSSATPVQKVKVDPYLPERYLFLDELLDKGTPFGVTVTCKHYLITDGRFVSLPAFDFTTRAGQYLLLRNGGEHYFVLNGPGISKAVRFYWNDQDTQFIELREVREPDSKVVEKG
jgi:hypothetical protein